MAQLGVRRRLAQLDISKAVPILRWLPAYDRGRLRGDLLAGAIVAALMIPQSLGYARIAGVPVEVGLYAVPLALLAYAVLGSSPQLIVGPASTVAIVSGSLVADIARDNPEDAVAITSALAIAAGIVLIGTGLLRIAWVAEFLSKPIVTGFVFGLTLTIVIGELPTLLGIPKPDGDLLGVLVRTVRDIGETHGPTAILGGATLLVLFGGRRITTRIPWGLVALVGAVVASNVLDLEGEGVATIGEVPSGLPPLGLPLIPRDDLGAVVVGGVSLALVALAEGLAATRLFATRGGYTVETENELVGMGAANVGAGLSGGLGVAGSLSKTASAEQAGSTSQVGGLTAAALVLVVLAAFTWFFTELPQAALSAIVVAAVWGLMDVDAIRRYWRVRHADFVAAMVGIAGVVLFGPLPGLGIAIATSLLAIIYRSSSPRMEVLGKIRGEKAAWGRMRGHTTRRTVPGVLVVRLDAPLFWANAMAIEDRLLDELERWPDTRALVLDLEATSQLETTSVDMLEHLHDELAHRGVQLYLARVIHPVSSVLDRSGFLQTLGDEHIWHSISQCVRAARRATGLKAAEADDVEADEADATDREPDQIPDVGPDDVETEVVDDEESDEDSLYAGHGRAGRKRDHAIALYELGIRDGRPHDALEAYVADRFVEHGAATTDGPERLVEFCEQIVGQHPTRYIRIVRALEDGNSVFLQVFGSLDGGSREVVATDFFRTDADDRLTERWSVVAPYTHAKDATRTAIDGPTDITDRSLTEANKALVRKMFDKALLPGGKPTRVHKYVADDCVEHGERPIADPTDPALTYDELLLLVGEGNFVATLATARLGDVGRRRVDLFRLQHGEIVEHWDNTEVPDDEPV